MNQSIEMMNKGYQRGIDDYNQGKYSHNFQNATWYAMFYGRGYKSAKIKAQNAKLLAALEKITDGADCESAWIAKAAIREAKEGS